MKAKVVFGFFLLMAIDTVCQMAFKLAALDAGAVVFDLNWIWRVLSAPWIYVVIVGYLCAFLTYMQIIKTTAIGPAYAASHLEIVIVIFLSFIFFEERMTLVQICGCAAIVGGVALLALTEQSDTA